MSALKEDREYRVIKEVWNNLITVNQVKRCSLSY